VVRSSTILDRWEITANDLTSAVDSNPSLRGMLFGYIAEMKLTKLLEVNAHVSSSFKFDDHDRSKKGDRVVIYNGQSFTVESKSLQTNSIRKQDGVWVGKAQVDASDRRKVELPTGKTVETTCLVVGEFDVLAVNLFAFEDKWRFIFAKNGDLPKTSFRGYRKGVRQFLLATLVTVTWPPTPPFHEDVFAVLEELIRERRT